MKHQLLSLTAVAIAGLLPAAAAEKAPLHPYFRSLKPDQEVQVIVRFSGPLEPRHHDLVKSEGGKLEKELKLINGAVYRITRSAVEPLLGKKEVLSISPDAAVNNQKAVAPPVLVEE